MIIGVLGDIPFQISSEKILTLHNLTWSGSANFATHQRHLQGALTEFTGVDPDQITFDIYFSAWLGVKPLDMIWQLFRYERSGTPVALTIGEHGYGKYRWTVVRHSTRIEQTDKAGNIAAATVSITLQEYLKE